jgi:DNA polymerase III epsilon subunit-like protein
VIEIAALRLTSRGEKIWHSLIRPRGTIPAFIKRLTGIDEAEVARAPRLAAVAKSLRQFCGSAPIIGHSIDFDLNFLAAHGVKLPNPRWDTLVLAGILFPQAPSHALGALLRLLKITPRREHRALDDVRGTLKLWHALLERIAAQPPEARRKILPFLRRQQWPYTPFFHRFLSLAPAQGGREKAAAALRQELFLSAEKGFSQRRPAGQRRQRKQFATALQARLPAIVEVRGREDLPALLSEAQKFARRSKKQTFLAFPPELPLTTVAALTPPRASLFLLRSPEEQICSEIQATLWQMKKLPEALVTLLVKLALQRFRSEIIELGALHFTREEKQWLPLLRGGELCRKHPSCPAFPSVKQKQAELFLLSHTSLKNLPAQFSREGKLVLWSGRRWIAFSSQGESIVASEMIKVGASWSFLLATQGEKEAATALEKLLSGIALLFARLGMWAKQLGNVRADTGRIVLASSHWQSAFGWRIGRLGEYLANRCEKLQTKLKSDSALPPSLRDCLSSQLSGWKLSLQRLARLSRTPHPTLLSWRRGEIILQKFPPSSAQKLPPFPSTIFVDTAWLWNNNFKAAAKLLQLERYRTFHLPLPSRRQNLLLSLEVTDAPPAQTAGWWEDLLRLLNEIVRHWTGRTLLLCATAAQVREFARGLRDAPLPLPCPLLVQGEAGSEARTIMHFFRTKRALLVSTASCVNFSSFTPESLGAIVVPLFPPACAMKGETSARGERACLLAVWEWRALIKRWHESPRRRVMVWWDARFNSSPGRYVVAAAALGKRAKISRDRVIARGKAWLRS